MMRCRTGVYLYSKCQDPSIRSPRLGRAACSLPASDGRGQFLRSCTLAGTRVTGLHSSNISYSKYAMASLFQSFLSDSIWPTFRRYLPCPSANQSWTVLGFLVPCTLSELRVFAIRVFGPLFISSRCRGLQLCCSKTEHFIKIVTHQCFWSRFLLCLGWVRPVISAPLIFLVVSLHSQ